MYSWNLITLVLDVGFCLLFLGRTLPTPLLLCIKGGLGLEEAMLQSPEVEGPAISGEDSPGDGLVRKPGGGDTSWMLWPLKAAPRPTGLFCRDEDNSEADGSELGLLMSE